MSTWIDTRGLKSLQYRLQKLSTRISSSKEVQEAVYSRMITWGNKLRNEIISSMVNTQRASHFYIRGGKKHFPSKPGNPPAVDSTNLRRSIQFDVTKRYETSLRIGSHGTKSSKGISYAEVLETTKDKNRQRPWLEPVVEKNKTAVIQDIQTTVHTVLKNVIGNAVK